MESRTKYLIDTIPMNKISGVNIMKYRFKEQDVLDTINFKPNPGDIFLVTYPKSGTTWGQYIIWNILHKAESCPELNDMIMKHIPYLEVTGTKITEDLPKPRIMKTHLPFKQNPYSPEAKYIYIARNVKDVCVSYFHFMKLRYPYFKDKSLSDFYELYLEGCMGYGSWYDHVHSWYLHKDDPNVLILTYEWMKENHREAVLNIASFLGKQYRDELDQDPVLLKKIVENTTFQSMKKIPVKPIRVLDPNNYGKESENTEAKNECTEHHKHGGNSKDPSVFFRKGEVGDWKNHLSKSQEKRLNEKLLAQSEIASVMTLWGNLWTIEDLHDN